VKQAVVEVQAIGERGGADKPSAIPVLPPSLWKKKWLTHSKPAERGQKVLDYRGRYVFRIAIANSRLESFDNGQVGFRYRDSIVVHSPTTQPFCSKRCKAGKSGPACTSKLPRVALIGE
jgi:hypothetical protein